MIFSNHEQNIYTFVNLRCQNQVNSNSQVSVVVSTPIPPSPTPTPPSSSSPPLSKNRPMSSSSNDAKSPHSSANSPSSKKPQANRFLNNQNPVLPSYPPLPPSHNRPLNNITSSSSGSSSSADASRSLQSVEVNQSNDARARRRLRARQSNPLPINESPINLKFLSKLSQNDTLQRRRRDQINNHLKQHPPLSSDDEHEIVANANPSQPVVVNIYSRVLLSNLFYS